ncbi:MAG: hypothetical protein H7301_01875 [Cryobacterium sp.]|nr:hypothetical protein [Oligoflexia bacterium]
MAGNQRATQNKRARERNRQESSEAKAEKRNARKETRKERDLLKESGSDIDPDLIGIVAGPQPILDEST